MLSAAPKALKLFIMLASFSLAACSPPEAIDMKTSVSVIDGAEPMKLGEVMQPIKRRFAEDMTLIEVKNKPNCKLPRPSPYAEVAYVYAGNVKRKRESRLWFPSSYKRPGTKARRRYGAGVVDVIITETEKPVYLVLGSGRHVLWVIHKANGVQISGISVVSARPSGLATDVPLNLIGFSTSASGEEESECPSSPEAYLTADERIALKERASKGYEGVSQKNRNIIKEIKDENFTGWTIWLKKNFGKIDQSIAGQSLESVLIGPPPEQVFEPSPVFNKIYVGQSKTPAAWMAK